MADGFVTIASYPEPIEANLIRSKLLSEGIECILLDENSILMLPINTSALRGIKLQVHENDYERAKEILDESQAPPMHIVHVAKGKPHSKKQGKTIHCPECNSTSVYFERLTRGELALSILFFGIPLLFIKGKYHCYNCGNKFNQEEQTRN
jgi:DNA-directed RNA polymerase subunit RPC12/RpoP